MDRLAPTSALLLAVTLAGAFDAAACSGGRQGQATGNLVRVDLSEWSIRAKPATVPAGNVSFAVKNRGRATHELVILKTDAPPAALPAPEGFVDENAAGETAGTLYDLRRGRGQTRTFSLEPGRYALICNLVGHYQLGMRAALEAR